MPEINVWVTALYPSQSTHILNIPENALDFFSMQSILWAIHFQKKEIFLLWCFYAIKILDTKYFRPQKSSDIKKFRHLKGPNI